MASTASSNEHGWFQSHLLAYRCGLMDEASEVRFRKLMVESDACRRTWEEYVQSGETQVTAHHIPEAMIARWPTARQTLAGLERRMVGRHLESCSECRQDLEVLGYEPVLEHITGSEAEPDASLSVPVDTSCETTGDANVKVPSTAGAPAPTVRLLVTSRKSRSGWTAGGWALAAGLVGILLFQARPAQERGPGMPTGADAIVPWIELKVAVRGPGEVEALRVTAATRSIVLRLAVPQEIDSRTEATIEVLAPGGEMLMRSVVPRAELERSWVMLLLGTPRGFEPGRYRVLLHAGGHVAEREFLIERMSP